jgi:hypothetical protein
MRYQISHGKYPAEFTFGDGLAGRRIAHILANADFKVQKRLGFEAMPDFSLLAI